LPLDEYQEAWRSEIRIPCGINESNVECAAPLGGFGSHVGSHKQSWLIILLELVFDDPQCREAIHPFEDCDIRMALALSGDLNKGVSPSPMLSWDGAIDEPPFEPCRTMEGVEGALEEFEVRRG
jgi:hypothetical protein